MMGIIWWIIRNCYKVIIQEDLRLELMDGSYKRRVVEVI